MEINSLKKRGRYKAERMKKELENRRIKYISTNKTRWDSYSNGNTFEKTTYI